MSPERSGWLAELADGLRTMGADASANLRCVVELAVEVTAAECALYTGFRDGAWQVEAAAPAGWTACPPPTDLGDTVLFDGTCRWTGDDGDRELRCRSHIVHCDDEVVGALHLGLGPSTDSADVVDDALRLLGIFCCAEERRRCDVAALRLSEQRFTIVFQRCVTGILIADRHERVFLDANPAICSMLGYTHDELVGLSVADIHPADQLDKVVAAFEAQSEGHIVLAPDLPCRRKDGTIVWADISSASMDIGGRRCTVGFFTDVSERRMLQDSLVEARKFEALGRLVGGIAHGFNNVLCPIVGYTELAQTSLPKRSPVNDYLALIRQAADESVTLVRHLLSCGQKQILRLQVIDLAAEIEVISDTLRRILGEWVEIRVEPPVRVNDGTEHGWWTVEVDVDHLRHIVTTLALSAREAMLPAGGTLTLQVRALSLASLDEARRQGLAAPGEFVALAVTDTGHGMDEESCRRVFEPFSTLDGAIDGHSLGLAATYGLVRQHGGDVVVQSRPGQGTTFTVILPRYVHGAVPGPKSIVPAGHGPSALTVLVVEDEPIVRELAQRMLTFRGYHVVAATDGSAALQLAAATGRPIDVLVTDVVMPGLSGPALFERLRAMQPKVRVVYMSGYAEQALPPDVMQATQGRFLRKPFTVEELYLAMNACLDGA